MYTATLNTETVRLTALTADDIPQLVEWRNSFALKRLTGPGPFMPATAADVSIESTATSIQFAIRGVDSEALMGYIALMNIVWSNRTADLGVFIGDVDNRGKRLGATAISLLLDYAFNELNLQRIQLDVVDYNRPAIRVYQKLGFTQEGARRQHGERDGKRYDVLLFGILASEWRLRENG